MREHRLMTNYIAGLLGAAILTSCVAAGDFCDVVQGPILFTDGTASVMVSNDRVSAERIDAQNRYGQANCPDW